jgi:hypothetical protein
LWTKGLSEKCSDLLVVPILKEDHFWNASVFHLAITAQLAATRTRPGQVSVSLAHCTVFSVWQVLQEFGILNFWVASGGMNLQVWLQTLISFIARVGYGQQETGAQQLRSNGDERGIAGDRRAFKTRKNGNRRLMWSSVVLRFPPEARNQLILLVVGGGFEPPTFGL